ncbi:hypothetical protein [Microbulbifer sp. VAAF005]|uniref:allophanate hydrolase-related protein n=1 Tax=Microbulbifer sp. VAAF005 TaxID=3034230 RepID=UPI0024AE7622|nr:hypothetical protein [Microbulbifer sp. VAAF005]WHI47283.1 hypothetical protein P0078_02580 [Microbulbifer sp. VAAF005]
MKPISSTNIEYRISATNMSTYTEVAVNGPLMRGLELESNLLQNDATFVREDRTEAIYGMWVIKGQYPSMQRVIIGGTWFDIEIWSLPKANLIEVLYLEATGLTLGKVSLENGEQVLGILGENYLTQQQEDISKFHGWRNYIQQKTND